MTENRGFMEECGDFNDIEVLVSKSFSEEESLLGPIPGLYKTFEGHYESRRGTDTTFIIRKDLTWRNAMCIITGIWGRYDGSPERFQIGTNRDGQWVCRISGGAARIGGSLYLYSNIKP